MRNIYDVGALVDTDLRGGRFGDWVNTDLRGDCHACKTDNYENSYAKMEE